MNSSPPILPPGFVLEINEVPSAVALNRLLSSCNERTHSPKRLTLALENSICNLSVFEERSGKLFGFVRATSDYGLNANLWNLVALPGEKQGEILAVLVHHVLVILRRDVPGCSISVSASVMAIQALKEHGFLIDPGGIRAMDLRLR